MSQDREELTENEKKAEKVGNFLFTAIILLCSIQFVWIGAKREGLFPYDWWWVYTPLFLAITGVLSVSGGMWIYERMLYYLGPDNE